jgi:hypothetical protein
MNSFKHPKLGFRNASVDAQITTCTRFVASAQSLSSDALASVPLSELEADLDAAIATRAELNYLRSQVAAVLGKQKEIMTRLRKSANRCAKGICSNVGGSEIELRRAGLEVHGSHHVRIVPNTPEIIGATGIAHGAMLRWRSPLKRGFFSVQYAAEKPTGWISPEPSSTERKRITIQNLQPGVLYWVRVKAHNANGESAWSQPVPVRAL